MQTLSAGAASAATPSSLLDPIVILLSAVPIGGWMWVAVAIAVLSLGAYAAHRALTPADVETLGARQAREMQEGARR